MHCGIISSARRRTFAPTPPAATYAYDFTGTPWSSQATGPGALYDSTSNKTFVAWEAQAEFRHIKVAAYDHSAGTWSTPVVIDSHKLQDDNHGMPALEILSDGRLVCFYGSHNIAQSWSISGSSGGSPDITSWTRQTAVSSVGNGYTYPKPVNIGSGGGAGTLYLFLRKSVGGVSPTNIRYVVVKATYTSGGALSFGAEQALINFDGGSGARVYAMEIRLNSGNIEFCATRADLADTIRQDVYYFRYIPGTGALENLLATHSTTSEVLLTEANANYREKTSSGSNSTGVVSWCRDSNGNLHIAYGDDTANPGVVTHDWHNGTSWQGASSAFTTPFLVAGGGYTNEWCLVPRGVSVDAYYPSGNAGGFTFIGGDNMARKTWSGSWGSEVTILTGSGGVPLGLPSAVRNSHANLRAIFTEVSTDAVMESFALHKRYFIGDGGYLEWPAPSDAHAYENVLVLNFEGTNNATSYSDESAFKGLHPITFNGNAKLDTTSLFAWGTSSLKLDGTGDYLSIAHSLDSLPDGGDWQLRGGDTVEVVFRLNATGKNQYLISTRVAGATPDGFSFIVNSSNNLQLVCWNSNATPTVSITGTTTLTTGVVYKASFTRKTDASWQVNLGAASEGTAASGTPGTGTTTLLIGRNANDSTQDFNGWIKQIRWTKMASRDLTTVPSADFPVN